MNELISINYENAENPTISGRELHEALDVKSKYADWFKNMCAYGFTENSDFVTISKNLENGGRTIEHCISINMAKELCMLQRSEKGKMFRQYFIDLEKQWNSPEAVMSRALAIANRKIEEIKNEAFALHNKIEEAKPKVLFADSVSAAKNSILVGDLAKILKQNGVDIGQKRLFKWLRENGYLIKGGNSKNMPTQKSADMGLFEVKISTISNPDGSIRETKTTKVTGKGQVHFINLFLSN